MSEHHRLGVHADNVTSQAQVDPANAAYIENVTLNPGVPLQIVPRLLPFARPVHEIVEVDVFIPGCPPSADVIFLALSELFEGRTPDLSAKTRFGA
jgi:NAD-reducing hydrogenase small subunit